MDTSDSLPSELKLSSCDLEALAKTFLAGASGNELFKKAASLNPVDVPANWPLPADDGNLKELFVLAGIDFVDENRYWNKSVDAFVITKNVARPEFKGFVKSQPVKQGRSSSDGALWNEENKRHKLMAILEAKTPGSETGHREKKVAIHSPSSSLFFSPPPPSLGRSHSNFIRRRDWS